jgi:uncharacterized SAM-binding protein YcdF (DUF218 family)
MPSPARFLLRVLRWPLAVAIVVALGLLVWGGNLLISREPVPQHVDAAIVLQGSIAAQKVRLAGAIDLLQRGVASRALLSVPKESYWGQSIPPVARSYLERNFGNNMAARVDFCETSDDVNSTVQEVQALSPCIREHQWHSLVVVTSSYHTRRAGILWRRMMRSDHTIRISVEGVTDPEFQQPWWGHRQSAKIWLTETTKLIWTVLGGR